MSESRGSASDADGARSSEGRGPGAPVPPAGEAEARLAQLLGALEEAEEVLVLTHDNPDPDAIASAAALAHLLEHVASLDTSLGFGGIVGRAENRVLMEEIGVRFERVRPPDLPPSRFVALVDTQPRTGNNSLPEGRIAAAVIDHHPRRPETDACGFVDVRPDYGASCTMLLEYLRAAGREPPPPLASALFYGIQSETMDLGREVSPADVQASTYLYPRSDPESISRIRHARVPAGYLGSVHQALERARRADGVVVVSVGRLDYPDMVAEMADLFMRVDGVEWTVASGRYHDDLLLSVRTDDPSAHAGRLVRSVVGNRGSAGGHGMLAGAQVPVGHLPDEEVELLDRSLLRDLLGELGGDPEEAEPVIPGAVEEVLGGVSEEGEPGREPPEEPEAS